MAGFVNRLLGDRTIRIDAHAESWEEAVRIGGTMMIDAGIIQHSYVEKMIDNHRSIGPYYIIAPGIAMPHASPEEGVLRTGYAVVTLDSPVEFGDEENDPVELLIFLAAANREDHMEEAMPEIAEFCDSPRHVAAVMAAHEYEEAAKVFRDFQRAFDAGELG